MQMQDLVKSITEMTDEELQEHVRKLRHRRMVARPAAVNRVKREAKVGAQTRMNKVDSLFDSLTDEEKAALILQLGGGQ